MKNFENCSIIIPAFNEENGIGVVIDNLATSFTKSEIIVVNDGSNDKTEFNAIEVAKKYDNVTIVSHIFNRGYGASLKTGMRHSHGEYIAWFDADNEHKVSDLKGMFDTIQARRLACVIGQRRGKSTSIIRGVGKWLIRSVARVLHFEAGHDLNCGLRVFRRDIITNYLDLLPDRYSASLTTTFLIVERGYPFEFYPIDISERIGSSKVKLKDGFFAINKVLHLIMLFAPMRIFFQSGVIIFLIGLIYSIYKAYAIGEGFPVAGVIFIFGGFLLSALGLIADQLSSIRIEKFNKNISLSEIKHSVKKV